MHGRRSVISYIKQQPRAGCETGIAQHQQSAAIEAVSHMSGNQKQSDSRQELAESDKAQVKGAVREVVNLPTDRDGLHFGGRDYKKSGNLIKGKGRVVKRDPPIKFCSSRSGHQRTVRSF